MTETPYAVYGKTKFIELPFSARVPLELVLSLLLNKNKQ